MLFLGPLRGPGGILPYLSPFHHHGHFSVYECPFEPAFIQKRNERERQRVKCVNQGYAKLRDHLPGQSAEKRLSKVETLRAAIRYIKYLQSPSVPDNGGGTQAVESHHQKGGANDGGVYRLPELQRTLAQQSPLQRNLPVRVPPTDVHYYLHPSCQTFPAVLHSSR
uniref:BHLH domain-containing protein n=1 Tax=Cyprinodon variegatus TaxID=28743 RepID=A0A3Q2EBT2_CYPVA